MLEKHIRLCERDQFHIGERVEKIMENQINQDEKEQVECLKEWAEKHKDDEKEGWVVHLFERFLKKE